MRALMSKDKCCPETKGEAITDGIDITSWNVPYQGETLTFSVWDFAGQTVYYNTHQVRATLFMKVINVIHNSMKMIADFISSDLK